MDKLVERLRARANSQRKHAEGWNRRGAYSEAINAEGIATLLDEAASALTADSMERAAGICEAQQGKACDYGRHSANFEEGYAAGCEDCRDAIRAASGQVNAEPVNPDSTWSMDYGGGPGPQSSAPDAGQVVPVEPTEEMLLAMMKSDGSFCESFPPDIENGIVIEFGMSQEDADAINKEVMDNYRKTYAAMLRAAGSRQDG